MGSDDEFGPDTETIRAWLSKRASYARDARVIGAPRGNGRSADPAPEPASVPATPRLTASPDSVDVGRSVLEALGAEKVVPTGTSAPRQTAVDSTDVGRSVVSALRDLSTAPAPAPTPPAGPASPADPASPAQPTDDDPKQLRETKQSRPRAKVTKGRGQRTEVRISPVPVRREAESTSTRQAPGLRSTEPEPQIRTGRWTEPEHNRTVGQASTDADFPARGGARRVLSVMLLATLAATGVAAYLASRDRTVATAGVAGTLAFLTLIIWAVRAGSTTTKLAITRGQLSITRGGKTELVELNSAYTAIALVGEPGNRRWTVLIERAGLPLVVINAGMVDPHWFTSALYRLRPDLRPEQRPELVG